jgi:hypothetical protein
VLAPTATVKEAMSNVKAAQRQREAAYEQGEADKVGAGLAGEGGWVGAWVRGCRLAPPLTT